MTMTRLKPAEACDATLSCPLSAGCAPGHEEPCIDVTRIHEEKLALCDALEAIADSLPSNVDRFECLRVCSELAPAMRRSHDLEETRIFPLFEKGSSGGTRAVSVARLKAEHVSDECSASDVSEELLRVAHGGEIENPEALGFMLRAFFESLRRHIAFEREHIVPVLLRSEDRS